MLACVCVPSFQQNGEYDGGPGLQKNSRTSDVFFFGLGCSHAGRNLCRHDVSLAWNVVPLDGNRRARRDHLDLARLRAIVVFHRGGASTGRRRSVGVGVHARSSGAGEVTRRVTAAIAAQVGARLTGIRVL